MLLIECNKIKKYFGDRLILDIEKLRIYSEDRIGIVGINGAGKTTLINILSKRLESDEGWVKSYGKHGYISQLESPDNNIISAEIASKFGIESNWNDKMSGGEKTRFKLAGALDNKSAIIFADEPTSNLDIEGIELLEEKLSDYNGGLILISHDRNFLDKLCNKIIEIENGKIEIYNGNYSFYRNQKNQEKERVRFEYEEYIKEKKRLEEVIKEKKQKSKSIKRAPKRMGNSEARLHKMGGQKAKANLDRAVKNVKKRIENLETKEKPIGQSGIKLDIMDSNKLHSKIIIEGKNINKKFEEKIIFKNAEFNIYNNAKIALIGPNGCGKTTLINMILNNENNIKVAKGAKIGYFSQDMNILKNNLSIIENVMESSIYPESFARLLLARLLFKGETIYKKIDVLSGGERVKVSFAKILLQDINLLILDEPTNYIDINALEVIEETLKEYDRTLLFVSHDRKFVEAVANQIMTIEDKKIKIFMGTYKEYLSRKNNLNRNKEDRATKIILLENRLSEVIGKLSMPAKQNDLEILNEEYNEIVEELKRLKN
ncbi:ribosomal protection-like ABC-F family protein [Sedimentibacter sp. MB31-C6]|uniref:ribosomal protection-like ABC-F family protein n=1 Tax=Sedimentibacter sp. MB31-C6 TaxID=3109366 RepID=UPI002DDD0CCA|nr:ABC-F type ribosomal protection protein [Sedimentibacter sp. MB36-C1]WSI03253.1 ABC-F type ribosomal protection protein [Sedimentibacter sp. MB36-C1]